MRRVREDEERGSIGGRGEGGVLRLDKGENKKRRRGYSKAQGREKGGVDNGGIRKEKGGGTVTTRALSLGGGDEEKGDARYRKRKKVPQSFHQL